MAEIFCINQVASVRSYVIGAGILGQGFGGPLGGLIADFMGWRWYVCIETLQICVLERESSY